MNKKGLIKDEEMTIESAEIEAQDEIKIEPFEFEKKHPENYITRETVVELISDEKEVKEEVEEDIKVEIGKDQFDEDVPQAVVKKEEADVKIEKNDDTTEFIINEEDSTEIKKENLEEPQQGDVVDEITTQALKNKCAAIHGGVTSRDNQDFRAIHGGVTSRDNQDAIHGGIASRHNQDCRAIHGGITSRDNQDCREIHGGITPQVHQGRRW